MVVTAIRGALGGVLMGLANLVPGISGGTMLLATGVYPAFIAAIAELTTLRFRLRSVVLLAVVAVGAVAAILSLAGPTRTLVIEDRWVMYSLFIGLTLGGVPLVWRLARPLSAGLVAGTAVGFALMIAMAFSPAGGSAGEGHAYGRLLLAGTAGAGAMILPGVSGGYLLLLLGQYLPILGAVDKLKLVLVAASAGEGIDLSLLSEALHVVIPVGIGVLVGIVGVSNLLQWTLDRFPKPTLGLLLGLLLGAVAGLWPFQEGVAPKVGEVFEGTVLNQERLAEIDPEDWPVEHFRPDSQSDRRIPAADRSRPGSHAGHRPVGADPNPGGASYQGWVAGYPPQRFAYRHRIRNSASISLKCREEEVDPGAVVICARFLQRSLLQICIEVTRWRLFRSIAPGFRLCVWRPAWAAPTATSRRMATGTRSSIPESERRSSIRVRVRPCLRSIRPTSFPVAHRCLASPAP